VLREVVAEVCRCADELKNPLQSTECRLRLSGSGRTPLSSSSSALGRDSVDSTELLALVVRPRPCRSVVTVR